MMKNTITQGHIDALYNAGKVETVTLGSKTTVVHYESPTGFVIIESSSCIDPNNYDQTMGERVCVERIKNKLWELEGYILQCKIAEERLIEQKDKELLEAIMKNSNK